MLWSDHLRYDVADPKSLANDRFVLSKGHASPLMFSVLKAVGAITDEQLAALAEPLRKNGYGQYLMRLLEGQ